MSSLAKEQRAGSQVLSFLPHCLYKIPSTGCYELLVGETLQEASSILKLSELQWALERTLSKQTLMRQSVPSPGYSYLNFMRSGWGLLFSICLMRKQRESQRDLYMMTLSESGGVWTSIPHRLIQALCSFHEDEILNSKTLLV